MFEVYDTVAPSGRWGHGLLIIAEAATVPETVVATLQAGPSSAQLAGSRSLRQLELRVGALRIKPGPPKGTGNNMLAVEELNLRYHNG